MTRADPTTTAGWNRYAYVLNDSVCDETLFRLPWIRHSGTYITEVVAERIRSAGLRGFDLVRC